MTKSSVELTDRNTEKLFVQANTLQCALDLCRPCCYKLIIHGGKDVLPNLRPEQCPRFEDPSKTEDEMNEEQENEESEIVRRNVLINDTHRVLTVGDGNFSYSLSLLNYLKDASQLVATSHESRDTIIETYPDGETILNNLESAGVKVLHEIDATNSKSLLKAGEKFDRVIWNFPCVRMLDGADGQNNEMETNKTLVQEFFRAVPSILNKNGEIHITHKTKPPYNQWGIVNLAESNGLVHLGSVVFDRCLYPGYSNKKVLSKGSFPIWDSETFLFGRKEDVQQGAGSWTIPTKHVDTDGVQYFVGWDGKKWIETEDGLFPVSSGLLRDLRILIGNANKKQVEEKQKSRKKRKLVTIPTDLLEQTKGKKKKRENKKKITKEKNGKKIIMQATKRNKKPKRHS